MIIKRLLPILFALFFCLITVLSSCSDNETALENNTVIASQFNEIVENEKENQTTQETSISYIEPRSSVVFNSKIGKDWYNLVEPDKVAQVRTTPLDVNMMKNVITSSEAYPYNCQFHPYENYTEEYHSCTDKSTIDGILSALYEMESHIEEKVDIKRIDFEKMMYEKPIDEINGHFVWIHGTEQKERFVSLFDDNKSISESNTNTTIFDNDCYIYVGFVDKLVLISSIHISNMPSAALIFEYDDIGSLKETDYLTEEQGVFTEIFRCDCNTQVFVDEISNLIGNN